MARIGLFLGCLALLGCESTLTPVHPDVAILSGPRLFTSAGYLHSERTAESFFDKYGDDYDFLVIFTADTTGIYERQGSSIPTYVSVFNDTEGIGLSRFRQQVDGSDGRLQGIVFMGSVYQWVLGPTGPVTEKGAYVLGHEIAHRWGTCFSIKYQGQPKSARILDLFGRHWTYSMDTDASPLGGYDWIDNGDGTFTASARWTGLYNGFDLYLMGLAAAREVEPMFLIDAISVDDDTVDVGSTIEGTAVWISIDSLIAAEGSRRPALDDPEIQNRFSAAFCLASPERRDVRGDDVEAVESFRRMWGEHFSYLTGGRAEMDTQLQH
jgi:hypothetical protein